MLFVAFVLLAGFAIIWYWQHRFIPPGFPESDSIVSADDVMSDQPLGFDLNEALVISVTGAANQRGTMRIALYDSEETFNQIDRAIIRLKSGIIDGESRFLLPVKVLPQKIAIAAFHDENDDGLLNANRLGIPSERYGFSRGARGDTVPPSFDETVIDLPPPGVPIELSIR